MSWLNGRVILITGGASGLGREVALRSAKLGAKVALLDTHAERLESTAADVRKLGAECVGLRNDITREEQVVSAVGDTVAKLGGLDTVLNAAGVFYGGPIETTPIDQFDRVFNVNVRGLYLVCREAVKAMLPKESGHLINIASITATKGIVNESVYGPSKWAVRGLGEVLAQELGPRGIRITTIHPDGMDTTFWENDPRRNSEAWRSYKMLSGGDVAEAIVQIASLPPSVVVKEAMVFKPGS